MHFSGIELLVILGVVLLFFGPKRLPGLGNALGSAFRGFKRGIAGQEDASAKSITSSEDSQPKS